MTTVILLFILWRVYIKFPEFINKGKTGTAPTAPYARYIFLAYAAVVVFQASAGALVFTQKGLGGAFQGVLIVGAIAFVIYRAKKVSGIAVPKFNVSSIANNTPYATATKPLSQSAVFLNNPVAPLLKAKPVVHVPNKPMVTTAANPVQRMHKLPTDGRIKPGWFS